MRPLFLQLKKRALYWIAKALKDEPDKCGARLQHGRLVSTADDQAVSWKPLLKVGMGTKRYKKMSEKGEKENMLRVVGNLRKLHSKGKKKGKSAGRTFLALYLQYLPEDPHKLQEPTVASDEARSTTHPGFDMGVQYCLLGQMINRPGATVPRHYAEQSNPWYAVADAFLGCDGDPSHCDCGEGSVKVWVSKVHEELKTQIQSAPMSGASLPHQQLEENKSYIWPIRLIVDRPKPKPGRPPGVEKKKRERNVAGSSKSTGARSSRQKHNEEVFREDVLKPTKAVTNMPGLEHMYRRQKEGARQPNAHRKLPK